MHNPTPGPWIAWDDGLTIGIEDITGEPIAIAEIVDHGDLTDRRQLRADQLVMAASREMLAALKIAERHISPSAMEYSHVTHGDRVFPLEVIRSTISKAEGRA